MTASQKAYLFGSDKIPRENALTRKWTEEMGGSDGVIAAIEQLPTAITDCIAFQPSGLLIWCASQISEEQASLLIAELKAQLGIKTRAKKESIQ